MGWAKKLVIVAPFVIAAVLNVLMLVADRFHLHREHIAGCGFLFGSPWAWLIDHGWVPHTHHRWLQQLLGYALILWIPAALYSASLWLVFLGLSRIRVRRAQ